MSERKVQNREIMRFSCTEEDSLYAIRRLREKEEKGQLSKSEERQLFYMENLHAFHLLPHMAFLTDVH